MIAKINALDVDKGDGLDKGDGSICHMNVTNRTVRLCENEETASLDLQKHMIICPELGLFTQSAVPFVTSSDPDGSGKTAWLFAGQGSQVPGMGHDIYQQYPSIQPIFASQAAGFDLAALCFEADAATLANTRYTQACMAAFAAAVIQLLGEHGQRCDIAMGLSLGEYCALYAAGVLDTDSLLALLGYRGQIMAEASSGKSRMTAVFGLSDSEVERATAQAAAQSGQVVSCSNYNCPGQVVIGGEEPAVLLAEELLRDCGARRLIVLNTSGPFHTALMSGPAALLNTRLQGLEFKPQRLPVVFNATASTADDSEVKALLVRQIAAPVLFAQSLMTLRQLGVTRIIEIGPGHVLAGLVKKTTPEISVFSIENVQTLQEVLNQ